MGRDNELDEAQRELSRPYIEKPDEMDNIGLDCWIDKDRICQSSCMAFDPEAPEGSHQGCRLLGAADVLLPLISLLQQQQPKPDTSDVKGAIFNVPLPSVGGRKP